MQNNPAIDILGILPQSNWRAALILLAQMNESLEWLVERATNALVVEEVLENLSAMVNAGPEKERASLRGILKQYKTDPIESDFSRDDD